MALHRSQHPFFYSDIGAVAGQSDVWNAFINGSPMPGVFAPLQGGLQITYSSNRQPHKVSGSVRMVSFMEQEIQISLNCVYSVSQGSTQNSMNESLGIGASGWRWSFRPGDVWRFVTNPSISDRGAVAGNSLRDFINKNLYLDSGASFTIPQSGMWSLSLRFFAYPESNIMEDAPLRNSATGIVR